MRRMRARWRDVVPSSNSLDHTEPHLRLRSPTGELDDSGGYGFYLDDDEWDSGCSSRFVAWYVYTVMIHAQR